MNNPEPLDLAAIALRLSQGKQTYEDVMNLFAAARDGRDELERLRAEIARLTAELKDDAAEQAHINRSIIAMSKVVEAARAYVNEENYGFDQLEEAVAAYEAQQGEKA